MPGIIYYPIQKIKIIIQLYQALPSSPSIATSTAFTMPNIVRKEHSTSTRIKAIYMLEQRQSAGNIRKAIGVSRTRIYKLASLAR